VRYMGKNGIIFNRQPLANFFTGITSPKGDSQFSLRSLSTTWNHYIKKGYKNEIQDIVLILVIVHYIYTNYINFN
jgi:hypothetical protein